MHASASSSTELSASCGLVHSSSSVSSTPVAVLLNSHVEGGRVTEAGVRLNISVALLYLDAWLGGNGAAAINNLMEDAATAEISRSQLWQWRTVRARLDADSIFDGQRYREIRDQEIARLGAGAYGRLADAAHLLD